MVRLRDLRLYGAPDRVEFFRPAIRSPGCWPVFATFGLGFVVRPLGGILIGRLGDAKGRKVALLVTLPDGAGHRGDRLGAVARGRRSFGALASTALPADQGFSAGGEWASATTFIYERAPAGRRGFFSSLQQSSVACGTPLGSAVAALFATLLTKTQMADFGWRIPFRWAR